MGLVMKMTIKNQVAQLCHALGVFKMLRSIHQNEAFVLAYHRVLPCVEDGNGYVQPGMYVRSDTFRLQMSFLKENFDVLPLTELVDRISNGMEVAKCCSITFDDGWVDNYHHAFPILLDLDLPATVFLATGFIETDRLFWPEEVSHYLASVPVEELMEQIPLLKDLLDCLVPVATGPLSFDGAIEELKTWAPERRNLLLSSLRSSYPSASASRLLMNWDEIREMRDSGLVSIGAHTKNHVILDQLPLNEAEMEICQSRDEIHAQLGFKPDLFAYPNGNVTTELHEVLNRYGFRGGLTTRKGWFRKVENRFDLPRFCMHEDVSRSLPLFQARLHFKGL